MTARSLKVWYRVHKWTSLACTLFLLMLCLTGLPLIFKDEIGIWSGTTVLPPEMRCGHAARQRRSHDRGCAPPPARRQGDVCLAQRRPAGLVRRHGQDGGRPEPDRGLQVRRAHRRADPRPAAAAGRHVRHPRPACGAAGRAAGHAVRGRRACLCFVAALVSGVVLYAPFMRKLEFGTVRRGRAARSSRLRWLDLHNFLGIVRPLAGSWSACRASSTRCTIPLIGLLAARPARQHDAPMARPPPVTEPGLGAGGARQRRRRRAGMESASSASPAASSPRPHHYMVFMRGDDRPHLAAC